MVAGRMDTKDPQWEPPAWSVAAQAVVAGALGATFLTFVAAAARVYPDPVGTSDFQDYCSAILSFRTGDASLWPAQRSVLPGLLPAALDPYVGMLPALVWSMLLSTWGWVTATWLWAWAIGGRRAGWLAAAWVGAFGPLVVLARTVSFYPEVAFLHVAAAASVAAALARGRWGWSLASALTLGLLPLADVRSVLILLALAPFGLLATLLLRAPWWARLLLFGLHLAAWSTAWTWGGWTYPAPLEVSLQASVYNYARDAGLEAGADWLPPLWESVPAFAWARTPIDHLPAALDYLRRVDASRPAAVTASALERRYALELLDWLPWLAGASLLALVRPRARGALALLATAPAFFVLLRSAALTLPHPRQLALGSAALPVVFGLGSATVLWGLDRARGALGPRWPALGDPRWRPALAAVAVAVVLAMSAGLLGGRAAPWRSTLALDGEPAASVRQARSAGPLPPQARCAAMLRDDGSAGHPIDAPLLPIAAVPPPPPPPPPPRGPHGIAR